MTVSRCLSPAALRSSHTGWPGLAHLTTPSITESRVHNERCTPGSGRGRSESYWRKPARRRAPTSPKSTSLARKRHDPAVPTVSTSDAKEAVHEDATTKVRLELVEHEGGKFAASRFQICRECRPVFLYHSVEQCRFRTMALERAHNRAGVTACCWLRGKHQQELSAARRYWLPTERDIRHGFGGSPRGARRAGARETGRVGRLICIGSRHAPRTIAPW